MKSVSSFAKAILLLAMSSWTLVSQAQTPSSTASASVQASVTGSTVASASQEGLLGRSNLVFVVRHAIAPGTGDPPEFRLGDCSTQRNLSQDGIRQAQELGKRLKSNGMAPTSIWSSQWCRAMDTANNLGLGPVTPLPALNSFFSAPQRGTSQMKDLERFLAGLDPSKGPYVMVTHQVVITTLTGVFPSSGEGVWLKLTGDKNKPWVIQPLSIF